MGAGRSYLSVHQESDGERHIQSSFRLDLDGLHLWLCGGGVVSGDGVS